MQEDLVWKGFHLNLLDPADRQKYQEMRVINHCSRFVAKSVESARRLLKEK
jgi:hypothetical protein